MWEKICNPVTGRMVSIYGKVGRKIIKNYIKKISDIASLPKGKKKNKRVKKNKNKRGGAARDEEAAALARFVKSGWTLKQLRFLQELPAKMLSEWEEWVSTPHTVIPYDLVGGWHTIRNNLIQKELYNTDYPESLMWLIMRAKKFIIIQLGGVTDQPDAPDAVLKKVSTKVSDIRDKWSNILIAGKDVASGDLLYELTRSSSWIVEDKAKASRPLLGWRPMISKTPEEESSYGGHYYTNSHGDKSAFNELPSNVKAEVYKHALNVPLWKKLGIWALELWLYGLDENEDLVSLGVARPPPASLHADAEGLDENEDLVSLGVARRPPPASLHADAEIRQVAVKNNPGWVRGAAHCIGNSCRRGQNANQDTVDLHEERRLQAEKAEIARAAEQDARSKSILEARRRNAEAASEAPVPPELREALIRLGVPAEESESWNITTAKNEALKALGVEEQKVKQWSPRLQDSRSDALLRIRKTIESVHVGSDDADQQTGWFGRRWW